MKSKSSRRPWWPKVFSFNKLLPATEKIGYTALGILLAFWVNNCDEGRKKREIEQKTLMEVRAGLVQDRLDIQETISGYEYRVWNIQTIFNLLARDSVPGDSLASRISDLVGYSYLLANTAAYETLKSRGLEIVTNDSLRLAISTLYDVDYEAIQQSERHLDDTYNALLLPHLVHFRNLGQKKYSTPEIKEVAADRPFQQILWQVMFLNQSVLERYQHSLQNLEKLLQNIDAELNSRRF